MPLQLLYVDNGNIGINSRNQISGGAALYFYNTPYGWSTAAKTAIITEGVNNYTMSKLHLCTNGVDDLTTSASVSNARLTVMPWGFVGINNTNPAANLDIIGSLRITSQTYAAITSGTGVDIIYSGAGQLSCGTRGVGGALTAAAMNYAASGHTFFTGAAASANAMTINSSGQVGIGIASPPPHRLTVFQDGNSLSHEGNAHSMSILSNQGTAGVNQMFMMLDADHTNQCCSIQSIVNALKVWNLCLNPRGGNIGIGITNPGHTLHVVGAIFATGDITAFSDQRYKQNIIRLDRSLDAIRSLSGYSYTREDYRPGERQIGLLAQEVKAVLPEAVSYDSIHDTYSVNYNCLMAPVVESIKELYDQIQAQKAAIRDQQAAIRDQQAIIQAQQSVIQKLLDRLGPE
jgi:hypothetical protein